MGASYPPLRDGPGHRAPRSCRASDKRFADRILLSGKAKPAGQTGPRSHLPWFAPGNFETNLKLVDALGPVAAEKDVTTSQLAWALARRADLVPVVGARTLGQLEETLAALRIVLTPADIARTEAAIPRDAIAGTR